jgi:uncharacterized protein YndB with AHSA1/START domain
MTRTEHGSFTLERVYPATPARVFAAWAEPGAKKRWFHGGAEWSELEREFDFRPGGHERAVGRWQSGQVTAFDARYFDIVPGQRIVYAYEMKLDGKRISVSLATVELVPEGRGTCLRLTEQGVFLDYDDGGSRERGTEGLLDRLGESLRD